MVTKGPVVSKNGVAIKLQRKHFSHVFLSSMVGSGWRVPDVPSTRDHT